MFPILSWKRIILDNIETPYIISSNGIVMNDITGEFLKMYLDKDKYPIVKLKIDGKDKHCKVHRLVFEAFNENPFELPEIDHINRNHWDNTKENLEAVTGIENLNRLYKLREIERDKLANYKNVRKERTKYTDSQIFQVCLRLIKGDSISKTSKNTGVDTRTIYLILDGKIWKHISCYFSFKNDSIFGKKEIKNIKEYFKKGFTNKAVLSALNIDLEFSEYFDDILNKLREEL